MSSTTETITESVAEVANDLVSCPAFTPADAYSLTSEIILLMGGSFILGSLVTTFLLLMLDFMRRNRAEE